MANNTLLNTTKVEKNIRKYEEENNTYYYVFFNQKGIEKASKYFFTLEQAREYKKQILDSFYEKKFNDSLVEQLEKIKFDKLEFPHNFLHDLDITEKNTDINEYLFLVDNVANRLVMLLNHSAFTDKEREIICDRYIFGKTLEEIGKKYNVSKEAIRQKVLKGMKKCKLYINYFKQQIVYSSNEYYKHIIENALKPKPKENVSINDLPLSIRATNSLKRAGYKTLKDLLEIDRDNIKDLKNVGAKTLQEILRVIDRYND